MNRDINELRDATFRRIGRNVINFQRLEFAFKVLIPAMSVSGAPHELVAKHAQRVEELNKQTLGNLARIFHTEAYGTVIDEQEYIDSDEVRITVKTELDPNRAEERRQALQSLIDERNRLIHHDLAFIDFSSPEACDELSAKLDEQNELIGKQLSRLEELRDFQSTFRDIFSQLMQSEEFRTEFLNAKNID